MRTRFVQAVCVAVIGLTGLCTSAVAQATDTGPTADGYATTATHASGVIAGRPSISFAGPTTSPAREVWFGHWSPGPMCSGSTCSITSTDDLPRFWISGQNFSHGSIYVGIFNRDGTPIVSTTLTSGVWQGFVAYAWGWKANKVDCAAIGAPVTDNAFIQAKDLTNNQWSNRIFVTTACYFL